MEAQLTQTLIELPASVVFGATAIAFAGLYFGAVLGQALWWRILGPLGYGAVISERQPKPGQIRQEIRLSLISILVFAGYGLVVQGALATGLIELRMSGGIGRACLDIVLIVLWNDLHFYLCHRLLHGRWLMAHVHAQHHASRVPTPYSTYSFHWFEALLLGSVMVTGLALHDFHIAAVILLPVISIATNVVGHGNRELIPCDPESSLLGMARRHVDHHELVHGNFGFLFASLDRFFGTEIRSPGRPPRAPAWSLPKLPMQDHKLAVGSVVLLLTAGSYGLTNHLPLSPTVLELGKIDRLLPVLPWTAWIYASYPLLFVAVFFKERCPDTLSRYMLATLAVNFASNLIFVTFPTAIDRSAFVFPGANAGASAALLAWIQSWDQPVNCLPSLHVCTSFLSALVLWRRDRTWFPPALLWALAIAISTMTTKQHLFIDVVTGVGLACLGYWAMFIAAAPISEP